MAASAISASELCSEMTARNAAIVIDVRRRAAFAEADAMITASYAASMRSSGISG
jgi:hypothetical protein